MPAPKTTTAVESIRSTRPQLASQRIAYELSMTIGDPLENPTEHFSLTVEQYTALKDHLTKISATPLRSDQKLQARMNEAKERAAVINNLLGGLNEHNLEQLELVRLMNRRIFCGIDDPMSKFICDLIFDYGLGEAEGRGMTIDLVESELKKLRENMEEALSEAKFITDRYPRPEASDAK